MMLPCPTVCSPVGFGEATLGRFDIGGTKMILFLRRIFGRVWQFHQKKCDLVKTTQELIKNWTKFSIAFLWHGT
jgi:hypothetical protein